MIDQKQLNAASKGIGCFLIVLGIGILIIGISLTTSFGKDSMQNTIMVLMILSGSLLVYSGYGSIKKSRLKDKEVDNYRKKVDELIAESAHPKTALHEETARLMTLLKGDDYVPDVIAQWHYTKDEWRTMHREERKRRFREGIWVTLLITLIGGWAIHSARETSFATGLIISFGVGVFISLLKVWFMNGLLAIKDNNTVIITTNAVFINGQFKTIQDDHFFLEYLKRVTDKGNQYIEFSIQWQTRNGPTNDQFRILVPFIYEKEIPHVLDYYKRKGVKIED